MDATDDTAAGVHSLASEFTRLGRLLGADQDAVMRPERIVSAVTKVVPDASGCAITLTRGGERPRSLAYTGSVALQVDLIQFATNEGPCLDSLDRHDATIVDDLRTDTRWPTFARRCTAETDVRSILSLRLVLEGTDRAAINLYANQPGRFGDEDVAVASMFAPFVALSVQSALDQQRATNLEVALQTSRQIGTAMGILMVRELVTSERAFELLREASQNLNRKLRDIAAEVEFTGSLPDYDERHRP